MSGPTPGPWAARSGAIFRADGYMIAALGDDEEHGNTADTQAANAALMSAAPQMLEALLWAEGVIGLYSKDPAPDSGIAKIRNAIAKATGASQ